MDSTPRKRHLSDARKTIQSTFLLDPSKELPSTHSTIDVKTQISDKYKTFTKWNFREALTSNKKVKLKEISLQKTNSNNLMNTLVSYMNHLKQKEEAHHKVSTKKQIKLEQLQGVKDQRRERLKKISNPVHLIQHYISKEGYQPTQEQNIILDRIIKLKQFMVQVQPINLDVLLMKLYKTMNIAVDLNQMKFFIGTILLTADICFQFKDYVRALHFYTQTTVAATCTNMFTMKSESFIKIGLICMDLNEYQKALLFYKKALQYCWKARDQENQLRIYDLIGQSFYYQGNSQLAVYYHNRAAQGEMEGANSAIKRISAEMLNQFDKTVLNSQKHNLSRLFIEYLDLPITNFFEIKPVQLKHVYANYFKEESPRKERQHREFNMDHFESVDRQIQKLLNECSQFISQLPNPDIHQNFVATHRFGKPKKQMEFQKSNLFHKLRGMSPIGIDKSNLKLPLDDKIDEVLTERQNPFWWEQIVMKIKKQKQQKVGSLRKRVWNTHKSYHKYPEQRKRASSLKSERISESINKTILNLVDPPRNI